jgi:hypothetical protein
MHLQASCISVFNVLYDSAVFAVSYVSSMCSMRLQVMSNSVESGLFVCLIR